MTNDERTFRPDIEGLRAVAVALVVLGHAGVPGIEGGYIGVDVFFVVSGFLITGLLLRERTSAGSTSLPGFYARRARRILPAASVVLVVTVLASYQWLGFLRGGVIAEDGKWTAVFAANLHFASEGTQYLNILAPPSPLQHYWSLAVEEQFYLVWPLVFLTVAAIAPRVSLAGKLTAVLALIAAASFAWSVVQTGSNVTWAFFSPLTRAWELAVGALLAVGLTQLRRVPAGLGPVLSWSGLAAIVGSAFLLDNGTAFPGYAAALPVCATAMVVAGGTIAPRRGAERVLGLPPFQVLGKWSYSLYLWHWPILLIAAQHAGHSLTLGQNLGLVAVAFGLAAVTHYAVENPVRYARPLIRHPWASVSAGLCLALAAYGVSAWEIRDHHTAHATSGATTERGYSGPLPDSKASLKDAVDDVLALVAAAPGIRAMPPDLVPDLERAHWDYAWMPPFGQGCLVDPPALVSPPCVFGDPDGSRTVVLLGDSHAAMWLIAFDAAAKSLHWKVTFLGKAGCPAVSISFLHALGRGPQKLVEAYPECSHWLNYAIDRINGISPDAVVLASCNGCEYMVGADREVVTKSAWAAGLRETLNRITTPNVRKAVLGDIPRWAGTLDCLVTNESNLQACSKQVGPATDATYNDVEKSVATEAGAAYIDVTPWFCGSVCTVVVGNMVVYTNEYHVTATYASHLWEALESALEPIVDGN